MSAFCALGEVALLALAPAASAGEPRVAAPEPYSAEQLSVARELTSVAISPDGCRVAYAADVTGAQEVWLSEACEPPSKPGAAPALKREAGWPEQLSALGEQAVELQFSPDGREVLFASDHGGDERRDLYLARLDGGAGPLTRTPAAETDPDADSGAAFSPDGRRLAYVADGERPFFFQLFVMDLSGGTPRQLTREGVSLRGPVWSPDGRTLAVTRSPDGQRGDLLLVDLASGATQLVAAPVEGGMLEAEEYLPGGSQILCRARNRAGFFQLALVPASGGAPRLIGPPEWDVEEARARAGLGIVFSRNEGGRSALYRLARPEAEPQRLLGPGGHIAGFDVDAAGRRIAVLWGDSAQPADVWVLDVPTGGKIRLTRALAGGIDPGRLARAQLVEYRSADGTPVQAFHLPPATKLLGDPPPVVVAAHGGPDWQTFDEFDAKLQALSQAGFAVLAPNYRGSSGYGKAFLDLNNKDWGGGDLADLAAGVGWLASNGLADPSRAGITGGSYGGYLTLMALATATATWRAGVEAYGMPDLKLDFELSGDRFIEWYKTEMGTPQDDPALFAARSAVAHLDAVTAPLLIFQGANDTNVPPAESELIYRKLLERKVPVGLVVYPDEGHGFTKRRNRADYYRRTVDFFRARLGPRADAAPDGGGRSP